MSVLVSCLIITVLIATPVLIYVLSSKEERYKTPYDDNEEFKKMRTLYTDMGPDESEMVRVGGEVINDWFAEDKVEFFRKYWRKKQEISCLPVMFGSFYYKTERKHLLLNHQIVLVKYVNILNKGAASIAVGGTEIIYEHDGKEYVEVERKEDSWHLFTMTEFLNLKTYKDYIIDVDMTKS